MCLEEKHQGFEKASSVHATTTTTAAALLPINTDTYSPVDF